MKPVFLFFKVLLVGILLVNISLADIIQKNADDIPVYVDGKLVSFITTRQISDTLNLGKDTIINLPTQNHWFSVVIKGSKGTDLSFQNWQRNYQGKEILLSQKDNKQFAGLYRSNKSRPLYYLENIEVIFIETRPPNVTVQNNTPLPPLNITMGHQSIQVDYQHLGNPLLHGWLLEHVFNAIHRTSLNKETIYKQFELACNDGEQKLTFFRPDARYTFLKVNQRNQWRAIVIDKDDNSKKNWKKCHQLVEISLY